VIKGQNMVHEVLYILCYCNCFTQLTGENGELCAGTLKHLKNVKHFRICGHGTGFGKAVEFYGGR